MKKLASVILAVLMVMALCVTAFAADTYTVTVNNAAAGHTYEAYQVFAGRLETVNGNSVLSDITWGTGVDGDALLTALKANATLGTIFADCTTAAQVAALMTGDEWGFDSENAKEFAKLVGANLSTTKATSGTQADGKYSITGLNAGYYFVKDQDASQQGDNDSATRYILQVVNNVEVTPKSSIPQVEKKVLEEDYNVAADTAKYGKGYNDVADYDIYDNVPFELIGTMPATLDDYATYNYIFTDTMSAGLTFNNDVTVTIDGITVDPNDYAVESTADGFTVSFTDIKTASAANEGETVTLTAASKVVVYYTAKLNADAVIGLDGNTNEVDLTYSNNPNGTGTGKTPVDKVIVFTYELDVTKVDGADVTKKLAGAEFKLYKMNGEDKAYATIVNGKVTNWTATEATATILTSDENGLFTVTGLDDADSYFLQETKAPTGYNMLATDVEVFITATTENGQTWAGTAADALTALDVTANGTVGTGNVDTGIAAINIANNTGATLPSTGGIGTTIFYVVGAMLMIGAAVLMITKKRVAATAA